MGSSEDLPWCRMEVGIKTLLQRGVIHHLRDKSMRNPYEELDIHSHLRNYIPDTKISDVAAAITSGDLCQSFLWFQPTVAPPAHSNHSSGAYRGGSGHL